MTTKDAVPQRQATLELAAEFGIHLIDGGDNDDTYEFSEDALIRFVDTLRTEVASELLVAPTAERAEGVRVDAARYRWLKAWNKIDGWTDEQIDRQIAIDAQLLAVAASSAGDQP